MLEIGQVWKERVKEREREKTNRGQWVIIIE